LQTKKLKREPFNTEIEEEVQKEWALMQEEAAKRKKVRAVAKSDLATTEALKDIQTRVEALESFIQKLEPDFLVWRKKKLELNAVQSEKEVHDMNVVENQL